MFCINVHHTYACLFCYFSHERCFFLRLFIFAHFYISRSSSMWLLATPATRSTVAARSLPGCNGHWLVTLSPSSSSSPTFTTTLTGANLPHPRRLEKPSPMAKQWPTATAKQWRKRRRRRARRGKRKAEPRGSESARVRDVFANKTKEGWGRRQGGESKFKHYWLHHTCKYCRWMQFVINSERWRCSSVCVCRCVCQGSLDLTEGKRCCLSLYSFFVCLYCFSIKAKAELVGLTLFSPNLFWTKKIWTNCL